MACSKARFVGMFAPMANFAGTTKRAGAIAAALVLLASLGLGCDPAAEASGAGGAGGSGALESCAATSQCEQGLRCIDNVCQAAVDSVLGDYHAALGRDALAQGNVNGAIERFSRAVNQYEADDLQPPASLYCDQGEALVADRMNPERAEVGARVLHRCLLMAPPGSTLRRRALAHLAKLDELGLEPVTLVRNELADAYLTRAPTRPPTDEVQVALEGSGTRARTFSRLVSHLESADLDAELAGCWEDFWTETYEEELSLAIPFQYNFRLTRYDDFDRAVIVVPDGSPPSGKGMSDAYACVVEVVAPLADAFSRTQYDEVRWRAEISFTIGPQ